jgi:hypothetical protein
VIFVVFALIAYIALSEWLRSRERAAHAAERRELANRIQAPQYVPTDIEKLPTPEPVPFDPGAWGQEPEID